MSTAVNNNGAASAPVSVIVMGRQDTLPSSRQTMAATIHLVYEGKDQRSPKAAALAYEVDARAAATGERHSSTFGASALAGVRHNNQLY